jgi:hypothetical protein
VCHLKDFNEVRKNFRFYRTTTDLRNDEPTELIGPMAMADAVTFLVREDLKNSTFVGIMIVLDTKSPSTLAHESIHYCDAVYEYLFMHSEGYNDGNEQYAYLVSWCVDCLDDFIKCQKKVRKTTSKTTKRGGN